ncbi:MAG: FecR domain-containing protein, partial [Chthoniobacteraceae bacterium]
MNDRIERAIEGLLSEEEWQALQTEILGNAELRAAYVERVWLHSNLRAGRDSLVELLDEPVQMPVPKRWPVAMWAAAAAACVTLAASFFLLPQRREKTVATLVQADHCKWAASDLPTAVNSKLGPGTLALVEGMATLKFASGATVTIEAPTKLEIRDAMNCRLLEGSLVADVPEPAHGFTVITPDMKVVDLGTRFGLTATAVGSSQVRVFEGEVEVGGVGSGKPTRLKEGKGMNFDTGTTAAGQEPSRGAQPVQESGGWTAIPTSFGRGKDT